MESLKSPIKSNQMAFAKVLVNALKLKDSQIPIIIELINSYDTVRDGIIGQWYKSSIELLVSKITNLEIEAKRKDGGK